MTTRLHLDSFRMSGAIPLLPLYAFTSSTGTRNVCVLLNGVHDVQSRSAENGVWCEMRWHGTPDDRILYDYEQSALGRRV